MKRYANRRDVYTFLAIFLSLCLIAGSVVMGAYYRSIQREKSDWDRQLAQETERAFTYLEQHLQAGAHACNNIFSATWYKHYRNVAGIYDQEFDGLKRIELVRDLASQVRVLQLVSKIVIITPSMDSVITNEDWTTLARWQQYYSLLDIDCPAGYTAPPEIRVIDENYCAMFFQDTTSRRDKSVVCMLVSKKEVKEAFLSMLGEWATWAQAELEGQTLFSWGEMGNADTTFLRESKGMNFRVEIAYKSYAEGGMPATTFTYSMLLFAVFCTAALLALLITRLLLKPIREMIMNLGGQKHDLEDPYRFIYAYVDDFARQRERLCQENDSLRSARRHFLSLMRNEIILGMLTNPEFNFEGEYIRSGFAWMGEGKPFLIAACMPKQSETSGSVRPAEHYLSECENSCYAAIEQQGWYLYWFADERQLEAGRALLERRLQEQLHVISDPLYELGEIHERYLSLRATLEKEKRRWLILPTSVQGKLLSKIYAGKHEESAQAVAEACVQYNPDAVLWLLIQVAGDCGFDASDYMLRYRALQEENDGETLIDLLSAFAQAQCRFLTTDRPSVAAETAMSICAYIRENYMNPEMSVNYLADQFSMHRTLISKAVKEQTGATFSDYLLHLRMERVDALMREGTRSFQQIGEQVGILSYPTFKRAFVKTYGCTPSEWQEKTQKEVDL